MTLTKKDRERLNEQIKQLGVRYDRVNALFPILEDEMNLLANQIRVLYAEVNKE